MPPPGRREPIGVLCPPETSARANDAARRRRLALSLAFVSGLTSLGYQVVWNRMLAAGTGNSTYVFTIILALFLLGIAHLAPPSSAASGATSAPPPP